MNFVDPTLEQWLLRADQCGPMPTADLIEELLMTAPIEAEQTAEHRFVCQSSIWREKRLSEEEIFRRSIAFWAAENDSVAA